MSQSPNVLVAVGKSDKGSIPQQTYENLFTEFNMDGIASLGNDATFYNVSINKPSTQGVSDFLIYGFMPPNYSYTFKHSIQQIVDFFLRDDRIAVVVCDLLNVYPTFTSRQYIHPQSPTTNIPFFIRNTIVDKIQFTDSKLLFQEQVNKLRQEGNIVFHIADPLISITHSKFESH